MSIPLLTIFTDGASRGNPGKAAYAYVIEPEQGDAIEEAGCLGTMTNNQAEYTALVRSLEHALDLGPSHRLIVNSDSELMVKQMKGEYRVKNEDLRDLFARAQELRKRFEGGVDIRHVRRAQNSRADALCNEVLDGKRLSSVRDLVKPKPAASNSSPAPSSLDHDALAILNAAAEAWKRGLAEPTVASVWRDLTRLLKRNQIKVPGESNEPRTK
jgi:ribonuclease HI